MRRLALLLLALLLAPLAAHAQATAEPPSLSEALRQARSAFDYGDYAATTRTLSRIDINSFETTESRVEAYKLLGLAYFFQDKRGDSYRAFLELLFLEPDYELDTFVVPPAAVSYFEQVKREAEPRLAPIRAERRREEEARLQRLREEAARRRQKEQEEEQRRLAAMAPVVERRVVQREFWVSMLPFGLGQLQNGDRSLGIALATSQVIAGATSAGSALLIEQLRDPSTGKFGPGVHPLAKRLDVAKWVGAALFYALWAGGAIHAAVHYRPESYEGDRLVTQGAQAPLPEPTLPPGVKPPSRPDGEPPLVSPPRPRDPDAQPPR